MDIKKIAMGVSLFGSGVGIGYFVSKKVMLERYKEELIEIKQFYMNKIEELGLQERGFEPEYILDEDDLEPEEDDEPDQYEETDEDDTIAAYNAKVLRYSGALRQDVESKGKPIIRYNKPPLNMEDWGDLEEDEDAPDEEEIDLAYEADLQRRAEEFAERKFENKSNGLPYVIDYTEYEDGPDDYDRITLYYYSEDRVLCEDDDTEVEDEEGAMGFDYEDVLDMQTTAWVRNDILMTLYEIHRVDQSFSLTVAGAVETPKERENRIYARRKLALDSYNKHSKGSQ